MTDKPHDTPNWRAISWSSQELTWCSLDLQSWSTSDLIGWSAQDLEPWSLSDLESLAEQDTMWIELS